MLESNRKYPNLKCYPEVGTIFYGAPVFSKVEGISEVKLTKDWNIVKPLTTFKLYNKSMNAENLKNHLLTSVQRDAGLNPENWIDSGQDGLSTNGKAPDIICNDTVYNPYNSTCGSYTLCRSGIAFATPTLDNWRKRWNQCIMHHGKLTKHLREIFGERPISAAGPFWYVMWLQHGQILNIDPESVITKVVEHGIANDYSTKSCQKTFNVFSSKSKGGKENMARFLIEMAAYVDGGLPLAIGNYHLEGYDPLILSAWIIFKHLNSKVRTFGDEPVPNV